ncbi:hypothetical protein F4810DRAFT_91746 [Camillea tinctor]|nr:hypothetical protein F4810DRAFT_91746 [Camillea tinctor]
MSQLLSLPTELLFDIVGQLQPGPDNHALLALILSNRVLKCIAEPRLYSSVEFRVRGGAFRTFNHALAARPELKAHVRDLALRWSTESFDFNYRHNPEPLDLGSLSHLTSFYSESPFCNYHWESIIAGELVETTEGWIRFMKYCIDSLEPASLQNLRHLTLHWATDEDYRLWDARPACPIFLLPSLHSLEISCMNIKWQDINTREERDRVANLPTRQTNLRSLTLIRCVIPVRHLVTILSFPKALEAFSFNDPTFNDVHVSGNLSPPYALDDMGALETALAQHASTLRRLELFRISAFNSPAPQSPLNLSKFHALEVLHLAHNNKRVSRGTWALTGSIPPALTSLRLSDPWPGNDGRGGTHAFSNMRIQELVARADQRGVAFKLDIGSYRFIRSVLPLCVRSLVPLFSSEQSQKQDDKSGSPVSREEWQCQQDGPRHRLRYLSLHKSQYVPPYLCDELRAWYEVRFDSWMSDNCDEQAEHWDQKPKKLQLDIGADDRLKSQLPYVAM